MANQWFKFYGGEYLSDPKIERLTLAERSCWVTLMCMASMSDGGVIKHLSLEGLLKKSGVDFDPYDNTVWENTKNVLKKLEDLEMIKVGANATITLRNWEKRQEHNLTVAERVAKSRAKKKDVTTNVTSVTSEENRIEENRIDTHVSFENFWSLYPRKVEKKKAEDKWNKLDEEIQMVILSDLPKRTVEDRQWLAGYIPHPTTYLNGERWNDEIATETIKVDQPKKTYNI